MQLRLLQRNAVNGDKSLRTSVAGPFRLTQFVAARSSGLLIPRSKVRILHGPTRPRGSAYVAFAARTNRLAGKLGAVAAPAKKRPRPRPCKGVDVGIPGRRQSPGKPVRAHLAWGRGAQRRSRTSANTRTRGIRDGKPGS